MKKLNLNCLKGVSPLLNFKNTVIFLFLNVLFYACIQDLHTQEVTQKSSQISSKKMRLLILPTKRDSYYDVEVTNLITGIIAELGRFELIDRNNLQRILEEQALQLSGVINDSMIVSVGNIAAA